MAFTIAVSSSPRKMEMIAGGASPIYADANTACDHNQLTMEVMKKVAARHNPE